MSSLFETMRRVEQEVRSKVLTCESEIILFLHQGEPMSAGMIFKESGYSSTSFYSALKRLAESNVIIGSPNALDRRSNVYRLNEQLRVRLDQVMLSFVD